MQGDSTGYELPGSKLILDMMREEANAAVFHEEEAEPLQDVSESKARKFAKSTDAVARWITPAHVFTIEYTCHLSASLKTEYSYRASEVQTPTEVLEYHIMRQQQGIVYELKGFAHAAYFDDAGIRQCLHEGLDLDSALVEIDAFAMNLLYYRCEALLPELQTDPPLLRPCLTPTDGKRCSRRDGEAFEGHVESRRSGALRL